MARRQRPSRQITLDQLLRMTSGLEWSGNAMSLDNDENAAVYESADVAGYTIGKPLEHPPGGFWVYSTGTSSILSRVIRDAVVRSGGDPLSFPRAALFDRIGMGSAIFEPDASGTFIGGNGMHATAHRGDAVYLLTRRKRCLAL